ncbi:MAG TPA: hypothetical protein PKI03_18965 [Pseudomonadota bacterium]|nr:hypothetical protein [Pseudomonadota bacterium]
MNTPSVRSVQQLTALRCGLLLASLLALLPTEGRALTLRIQRDVRGDVVLIGNTLGHDCRAMDSAGRPLPKPVVGAVGDCGDAMSVADSAPDVLWRADSPAGGQAEASSTIGPDIARSTAILRLPSDAQVTYARLYWANNLAEDVTVASNSVLLERPDNNGFSLMLKPDPLKREVATALGGGGGQVYQATADVTALIQKYGVGAYRLGQVVRRGVLNRDEDLQFAGWAMVVMYESPTTNTVRNVALFDGLDVIAIGQGFGVQVGGFNIPATPAPNGKLGVVAYDGDPDKSEALLLNTQLISDAQNPAGNVFNGSRSELGIPISVVGDLPQLTGTQGSMSGVDLDVFDVSKALTVGDRMASVDARITDDAFAIGVLFTSLLHHRAVIDTTLLSKPSSVGPDATVTFTSITRNVGQEEGTQLIIRHPLPKGLLYVPGTLRYVSGPEAEQNGNKTDVAGDDQAEVVTDTMTGQQVLLLRIGRGATATAGGTLGPSDAAVVVTYQLRTAADAAGDIPTGSTTQVVPISRPALPPLSFPSGDGIRIGAETVVHVPTVRSDLLVLVQKTPIQPVEGSPVSYHIDIKNFGNSSDPGPLRVMVNIPTGYTLNSTQPAADTTRCNALGQTLVCLLPVGIEPGVTLPVVDLALTLVAVSQTAPASENELTVVVCSDGASEQNPADNTWNGILTNLRALGGASDCAYGQSARLGTPLALGLAVWLLLVFRRRRPNKAAP